MSHLNILNISREIDNLNRNINNFKKQIDRVAEQGEQNNNNISDLEDIKINKLDVINYMGKIRDDFKFLETKLDNVDSCVKKLVSRNLDYVNKNKENFYKLLKSCSISDKQINIILYVLDCSNAQDFLAISEEELKVYNFIQTEINSLSRKCKTELENTIYDDLGI